MIGIDEVGRGAWAGPLLVVAARQVGVLPLALKDSKVLSRPKREALIEDIREGCELGEGWVEPEEIDKLGLTNAMKLAVARALRQLDCTASEEIIMDGSINYCAPEYRNVTCVIKADSSYPLVSAASIFAKVRRDNLMAELDQLHQGYGFASHVGYGTALHQQALEKLGVSLIHRKSYKPVRAYL